MSLQSARAGGPADQKASSGARNLILWCLDTLRSYPCHLPGAGIQDQTGVHHIDSMSSLQVSSRLVHVLNVFDSAHR